MVTTRSFVQSLPPTPLPMRKRSDSLGSRMVCMSGAQQQNMKTGLLDVFRQIWWTSMQTTTAAKMFTTVQGSAILNLLVKSPRD